MTELECPALYEEGRACGSCDGCTAMAKRRHKDLWLQMLAEPPSGP